MSRDRGHPRPEQVAELTRGRHLPLAPLGTTQLTFIADTLLRAWDDLLRRWHSILLSAGETEINALIETKLEALREEDELWSQLVRCVTKGTETISFDGSHLEKRPDLSIHLTRQASFPLVVECKLIDVNSNKKVDLYCKAGLARFLKGEYAWATKEAFMLGYVRDGSTIVACLQPFLADHQAKSPDAFLSHALPELVRPPDFRLARSTHRRGFQYLDRSHDDPGPIAIWHLWLSG